MGQTLQLLTKKELHVTFLLAYLYLTLAYSKSQGQGHIRFNEYLANNDKYGKHY